MSNRLHSRKGQRSAAIRTRVQSRLNRGAPLPERNRAVPVRVLAEDESGRSDAYGGRCTKGDKTMRGVLLWLIGIPIPIIILLYVFNVL
jgi:hypothetical protein